VLKKNFCSKGYGSEIQVLTIKSIKFIRMNRLKKINLLSLIGLLILASCTKKTEEKEENQAEVYISEIRNAYAPDKRVALFDVDAKKSNNTYILKGESNLPDAVNALKEKL